VLARGRQAVVRVSLLFGPSLNGRPNFFDRQVAALQAGQAVRLFDDEWRTPLDLPTAAKALNAVAELPYVGLLHVGGPERMSRLEMGHRLAKVLGVGPDCIQSISRRSVAGEPRPRDTSLDSKFWRARFPQMTWPSFEESLTEMGVR
jgi:dTDP-4-dehydrorhamnose reductase